MVMLMLLWYWRLEYDGISFDNLCLCLSNKDVSLLMRGKLCSCMLHDSETWPVKKENELTLQPAEMRTISWMCGVKVHVRERFLGSELTEKD